MRYYILLTIDCIVVYTKHILPMNPNDPYQNNPNPAPTGAGQPDLGSAPPQAPPQPPAIDSGFTWPPAQPSTPSITPQDLYGPSVPQTPTPPEAAPTDLSHLVANGSEQPVYAPPVTQPETLVAPPNGTDEIPNMPIENQSGGMPKWVLGLGIGILLTVVGASGYFILGIGKSAENTPASLPATTKQQTLTPPPSPITAPAPATESSSFGEVGGTKPATSAADLLKQRQGR